MRKNINWSLIGAIILGVFAIGFMIIGCVGCAT